MIIAKYKNLWLTIGLIVLGLVVATVVLHKKVRLTIDGQSEQLDTWVLSVQQFLNFKGIGLNVYDQIIPSPDTLITNNGSIEILHASTIEIEIDGQSLIFHAVNPIPSDLFSRARITINPGDTLSSGNISVPMDSVFLTSNQNHFWQLKRASTVTLHMDGKTKKITSTALTVGQALWDVGIRLNYADNLEPPADSLLSSGLEITIQSARPMIIQTANAAVKLLSSKDTISESLIEAGITLQGLDYTIPNEKEPIPSHGLIRLVRVTEDILIEQTPIPFETTYQPISDLEIDRRTVLEAGEYGINAQRIRIRSENGQEVSRQTEDEWLANTPKDRVIGYGTLVVMRSIDTPDGTVNYWRALDVYAVSYKPSDTGGNITSTGQVLKKGIIAVNPNYIPYGTKLYVPGYGYGVAADTGRLGPRMIDLGYLDEDYVSWHQNITIYFVWPPPENITWIIP